MITYRKATVDDIETLANLRSYFLMEYEGFDSEELRVKVEEAVTSYLRKAMPLNEFASWVAVDGEKIVGTSGLSFSVMPPISTSLEGKAAYVMNMYTLPEYRRQGLAQKLFELIVNEAKERGYNRVTLNASDMGKPLYKKFGFIDVKGDMEYYF